MGCGGKLPGGICGYWGSCGAAISTGIFMSIITNSTPLSTTAFAKSNMMISGLLGVCQIMVVLDAVKRDSYLSILVAIESLYEKFNIGTKQDNL